MIEVEGLRVSCLGFLMTSLVKSRNRMAKYMDNEIELGVYGDT